MAEGMELTDYAIASLPPDQAAPGGYRRCGGGIGALRTGCQFVARKGSAANETGRQTFR